MPRLRVLAILLILAALPAHAETQGVVLDLRRNIPWAGGPDYELLRLRLDDSDAPVDAVVETDTDFAVVAWKDGWLEVSGQVMLVLDHTQPAPAAPVYGLRLWQNEPNCANGMMWPRLPLATAFGYAPLWWVVYIPVSVKVRAHKGDAFRLCISATTNNPDGATTNYVDGNPAHTRLTFTMP